jgi:hypothetical protein
VDILAQRVDVSLHRERVNELLSRVGMVLQTYTYTGYNFPQRYLPFLDQTTLRRHYGARIGEQEMKLIQLTMIPSMLHSRKPFSFATIAVDAVCLDNVFLSDQEDPSPETQLNHAFVYECLLLMTDEHYFPVHIQPAMSGNAQALQLETARTIAKTLGELNHPVYVLFVATDGDKGYDSSYQVQLQVSFPSYWSSGLAACLALTGSMAPFLYWRSSPPGEKRSRSHPDIRSSTSI